jgi:ParB family chromosome partitioning protein
MSDSPAVPDHLPVMVTLPPPPDDGHAPPLADATLSPAADIVRKISVNDILPNPHQPRKDFDETSLAALAASLKTTGLIQPILVRPMDGRYQLIAGERRWRAATLAGIAAIPAIIREANSAEQAQIALVENIQREDLNPLERAQSYRALMDQLGLTQAELASRLGEDRSGIANHLRLLGLIEPVRELIRSGRLSFGHAKLLAAVEDMLEQQHLADLVVSGDLSVRQLEQLLQASPAKPVHSGTAGLSPHIRDLEQSLSRQLGMRVQVRSRGKKGAGQLMIHYSSLDQFDELLARLGTKVEPS